MVRILSRGACLHQSVSNKGRKEKVNPIKFCSKLGFLAHLPHMAAVNSISMLKLGPCTKPISQIPRQGLLYNENHLHLQYSRLRTRLSRNWAVGSVAEDRELVSLGRKHPKDEETSNSLKESNEVRSFENPVVEEKGENEEIEKLISRGINASLVLGAGAIAVTKLLTIDHDYWQVSGPYSLTLS